MGPAEHSWVAMSNLHEYINSAQVRPFWEPGTDPLQSRTDITAASTDVFNRIRVPTKEKS